MREPKKNPGRTTIRAGRAVSTAAEVIDKTKCGYSSRKSGTQAETGLLRICWGWRERWDVGRG